MRKQEFLARLQNGLAGLPQEEINERLTFYSEMIDDRMEEGLSEEAAVAAIGSVDDIIAQIIAETPLSKLAKERIRTKRHLKTWQIVLLILTSPIWFPLLITAVSVLFSAYVTLWSGIVALWSVFGSLVACALSGVLAGIVSFCHGDMLNGAAILAAGLVCTGLSVFLFYGCKAVTSGVVCLTKKFALWIKGCFIRKEDAT